MKKALSNFVLTLVLAIVFSMFMPWYAVMIAAFLSGAIVSLKKAATFVVPFLAIALFWIGYAMYLSAPNDFTLASKIAVLLPLEGKANLLLLVTGMIGGLAAGFAGLFGNQVHSVFFKQRE